MRPDLGNEEQIRDEIAKQFAEYLKNVFLEGEFEKDVLLRPVFNTCAKDRANIFFAFLKTNDIQTKALSLIKSLYPQAEFDNIFNSFFDDEREATENTIHVRERLLLELYLSCTNNIVAAMQDKAQKHRESGTKDDLAIAASIDDCVQLYSSYIQPLKDGKIISSPPKFTWIDSKNRKCELLVDGTWNFFTNSLEQNEQIEKDKCYVVGFDGKNLYEGEFVNNKCNGKGKLTFAGGGVYEGEFVDNKRHGLGKLTFACGDVYEGEFVDNKCHGLGKLTFAGGNIYEGKFVDDKLHGIGQAKYNRGFIEKFFNSQVYKGGFYEGKTHGEGIEILLNGTVWTVNCHNGQQKGQHKRASENDPTRKRIEQETDQITKKLKKIESDVRSICKKVDAITEKLTTNPTEKNPTVSPQTTDINQGIVKKTLGYCAVQ